MRVNSITRGLLLMTCFTNSGLQAADYQVEVLLFESRQLNLSKTGTSEMALPDVSSAKVLAQGSGDQAFELLPPQRYRLTHLANRLQDSSTYHLLTHMAWYQPLSSDLTQIRLVDTLEGISSNIPSFSGVIKLFNQDGTQVEVDVAATESTAPNQFTTTPSVFRLTEKRRVKADEIHYFDHPQLGVLVQLTKVETDETANSPAPDATTAIPVVAPR